MPRKQRSEPGKTSPENDAQRDHEDERLEPGLGSGGDGGAGADPDSRSPQTDPDLKEQPGGA